MKTKKPEKKHNDVDDFLALPDAEKERIWESFNREIPRSQTRAPTAAEGRLAARVTRKALRGRPKIEEETAKVQVTIEVKLLRQADAFAGKLGLTRSQLLAQAVKEKLTAARPRTPKRPAA